MKTEKSQEGYEDVKDFVFRRVYDKGFRTGFNGYCERIMLEANCFPKYLAKLASYSAEDFESVLVEMPRENEISDEYIEELRTRVQNPRALLPEDFKDKYPAFAEVLKENEDVRTYLDLYFLASYGRRGDFRRNTLENIADDSEKLILDTSKSDRVIYEECSLGNGIRGFKSDIVSQALTDLYNSLYRDYRELVIPEDKGIRTYYQGRKFLPDISEVIIEKR